MRKRYENLEVYPRMVNRMLSNLVQSVCFGHHSSLHQLLESLRVKSVYVGGVFTLLACANPDRNVLLVLSRRLAAC